MPRTSQKPAPTESDPILSSLLESLSAAGVEYSRDEILRRYQELVAYGVPADVTADSILKSYRSATTRSVSNSHRDVQIRDITAPEVWCNVRVRVVDLWENRSDKVSQSGLVGDSSGVCRFVAFTRSNVQRLEKGCSYYLHGVVTDVDQNGRPGIKLNRNTKVELLSEDIEVGGIVNEVTGCLVAVLSGSGLIKRCPQCSRVLDKGICKEHGRVDGINDLRIKGVLDNGLSAYQFVANADVVKSLLGIDVEMAKKMVMDAMDLYAVAEEIKNKIQGRYFTMKFSQAGDYCITREMRRLE